MSASDILRRLEGVIDARKHERPEGSYVVRLLDGGVSAIGAKVREEAGELVEAAAGGGRDHVAHEAADLLFHTWVLLAHCGVPADEVYAKLEERFGTGGLVEKARRDPAASGGRER